jgi:hypothetical protein
MRSTLRIAALGMPLLLILAWEFPRETVVGAADEPPPRPNVDVTPRAPEPAPDRAWTTAVTPKPLSPAVHKGLAWLAEHQQPGGGWSQGEESPHMGGGGAFRDKPDVADTCVAALAMLRSGSTPREGPYRDALARAVRFVRGEVEASDPRSLAVSSVQGTRVQGKLGPNIDTFLASLLLAEVKGCMPDASENAGVDLALNKVLGKLKHHQKADGSWDNQRGWAPILAESLGGKALNRARQNGASVPDELLTRVEQNATHMFAQSLAAGPAPAARGGGIDVAAPAASETSTSQSTPARAARVAGRGGASAGSAGVELYARAANIGVLQDSANTNQAREAELKKDAETAPDEPRRTKARDELRRIGAARAVTQEARSALLGRLDDAQFVSGFGSNGGEEFLSYMNISESLVINGGHDWTRWDDAMSSNLGRVQNPDGSWSGHHCITGRTFCTATALLVLLADRTPVPVAATATTTTPTPTPTPTPSGSERVEPK